MRFDRIAFFAYIITLVVSCKPVNNITMANISEQLLSFPPGYYNNVVYIDDKIVGFKIDPDAPVEERIAFAYEEATQFTLFNPEDDPTCTKYSYFQVVSVLPDGRLGLLKECLDDSASTIFLSKNRSIYAYDWTTGELERIVAGKLTQGSNPKYYTWNPDMTLGVQSTTSGYKGTIYWIASDGMFPMDIQIEDRGLTWNLKDHLENKDHAGLVGAPAWSHDGKTIAFFVTTYGILEKPLPKYNVNYDLFFMDPVTQEPKLELMNVVDADKIIWSPNDEYLLFRGCIGRKLICGLWRYKISNKTLSLIQEGEFADYIWITNEKIVAAKNIELPYNDNQVWEYTILE